MLQNQLSTILVFSLTSLLTFLFSISPLTYFTPQLLAFLAIIITIHLFTKRSVNTVFTLLSSIFITLLVFTTNGLNSPLFFLIYFLLLVIAFQNPPSTTLSYSLVLIILLSQSLDSFSSLLPLLSLLLITPLAWFIGHQYLDNLKLNQDLAVDETNIVLWHSLKFKTGITTIIDLCSQLLSTPLTPTQKQHTKKIKNSARNLLNSSKKLVSQIDTQTDE